LMSVGLPAEITKLAMDNEYFQMRSEKVRNARELLSGNLYQKLLIAQRYKDDRKLALSLLTDASNILRKSLVANPQPETLKHVEKLLKTYQRIEANGNIRLCIARMVI